MSTTTTTTVRRCSECGAPEPFDSAEAASWTDQETREVVAVTCSASCAKLREQRLGHAASVATAELERRRVAYMIRKATSWADNLEGNAARHRADADALEAAGVEPGRAFDLDRRAFTLEARARAYREVVVILSGGEDDYLATLTDL